MDLIRLDFRAKDMALPNDFYEHIKGQLHRRICRELRSLKRLLDIGCGACELDRLIARQNRGHIIGLDISDTKFPGKEIRVRGVQCRKGDAGNLDFLDDGSIDGVISVYALHEIKNALKALKEARRVLRLGGRIIIVDFLRDSLAQRLWNENYYTKSQVASILRRGGFVNVKSKTVFQGQLIWAQGYKACQ